jgi:hypothetical protein
LKAQKCLTENGCDGYPRRKSTDEIVEKESDMKTKAGLGIDHRQARVGIGSDTGEEIKQIRRIPSSLAAQVEEL